MEANIKRRLTANQNADDQQGNVFEKAVPKDLVKFGMIPELVGRFPVIVSTKFLEIANMIRIIV
jgi:ATP-dependent Clp protease ATP-binding subunit ClpX